MPAEVTELMVSAALVAEGAYLAERDAARRAASEASVGHTGAHIPAEAPDPQERVERMLRAALAGRHGQENPPQTTPDPATQVAHNAAVHRSRGAGRPGF